MHLLIQNAQVCEITKLKFVRLVGLSKILELTVLGVIPLRHFATETAHLGGYPPMYNFNLVW